MPRSPMLSTRTLVPLLPLVTLVPLSSAQNFGPPLPLATNISAPSSVRLADLDGDGDLDVLATAEQADRLYWIENLGAGQFGTKQQLDFSVDYPTDVEAADLDGDGDLDIVAAYGGDDEIALFENLGGGTFLSIQSVSFTSSGIRDLAVADLSGDGLLDLVAANRAEGKVVWHRNLGNLSFGPETTISSQHTWPDNVSTEDLDGDGDQDVLAASKLDGKLAWYENLGGGSFGPQLLISTTPSGPVSSVVAEDLDGDGDADVLASFTGSGADLAWYENLGGGSFGPQLGLDESLLTAAEVVAADLDLDGDADVLACSDFDNKLVWLENLGGGAFSETRLISSSTNGGVCLDVGDIGSTGWPDVIVGSYWGNRVLGIKNLGPSDCNGNGITDKLDIASGLSLDCNGNGVPDECDVIKQQHDVDGDGLVDACSPPPLMSDLYEHSLSQGVHATMTLTSPTAGDTFLLLGSASGTSPGLPVGGLTLPLNRDWYLDHTLSLPTSYPVFGNLGTFQPGTQEGGVATVPHTMPGGVSFTGLAGLRLHYAYLTFDAVTGHAIAVSNPIPMYVIP